MVILLHNFLNRLESRPHSLTGLVIVCGFTGIVRAAEEYLFFGERLTPASAISMGFAYLHIAVSLIFILSAINRTYWKRTQNAVYLGIFMGIFPPLIDYGLLGFNGGATYRYFIFGDITELPWGFYDPTKGAPLGEAITVWLSIGFCAGYSLLRTNSFLRSAASFAAAYVFMLIQFAFLPMVAMKLVGGGPARYDDLSPQAMRSSSIALALIPIWYLFLSLIIFSLIRPVLFKLLVKRFWHLLPFALLAICGGHYSGGITSPVLLAGFSVFVFAWIAAAQNAFFDAKSGEHRKQIEDTDMNFLNLIGAGLLLWLTLLGQNAVLPLIIIFMSSILYNYPLFRIKKFFPGSLKIEGLWAAMAFFTGILVFDRAKLRPVLFLITLLVFGGWSLLASWKDIKDIRKDSALGYKNFYTFLMARGFSLSKAYRIICGLGIAALLVPVIYAVATAQHIAALVIFAGGVVPLAVLTRFPTRIKNWFQYILVSFSAILIQCLFLLKI